jgi:Fe2+ transport system protein B
MKEEVNTRFVVVVVVVILKALPVSPVRTALNSSSVHKILHVTEPFVVPFQQTGDFSFSLVFFSISLCLG